MKKINTSRGLNIAAGILDILIAVGLLIVVAILFFSTTFIGLLGSDIAGAVGGESASIEFLEGFALLGGGLLIFGSLIFLAAGACYLGFGIATLVACKRRGKEYCAKKGKFLGFFIVEIIFFVTVLISLILMYNPVLLAAVLFLALVLSFRIAAFALAKQAHAELNGPAVEIKDFVFENQENANANNSEVVPANEEKPAEKIEE